jgi:hypothetical protein
VITPPAADGSAAAGKDEAPRDRRTEAARTAAAAAPKRRGADRADRGGDTTVAARRILAVSWQWCLGILSQKDGTRIPSGAREIAAVATARVYAETQKLVAWR